MTTLMKTSMTESIDSVLAAPAVRTLYRVGAQVRTTNRGAAPPTQASRLYQTGTAGGPAQRSVELEYHENKGRSNEVTSISTSSSTSSAATLSAG
jgi:hypothetical protein